MNLCGIHKEAISIIFHDSTRRLKILQNTCPQYFDDSESKELILPKINNYLIETDLSKSKIVSSPSKKHNNIKKCSTLSSDHIKNVFYGQCGKFERQMLHILESIEIKSTEIIDTQNIKFSNGKLQRVNRKYISEKKLKEDLHFINKCFANIIAEINEEGTFQYLINFVNSNKVGETETSYFIKSEKDSARNIDLIKAEIIKAKSEFHFKQKEYLILIQHMKHQKQEKQHKLKMEYQFSLKRNYGFIKEHKDKLKLIENTLIDEYKYNENCIQSEEKINTELMMYLRNYIQTMEQSIEYWIDIFNKESKNFQKVLKHLNVNFIQINLHFETLQKTYNEYETICIEARIQASKAAKIAEAEAQFNKNALLIQNWWRYICCNLLLGPYSKKKKKKNTKG